MVRELQSFRIEEEMMPKVIELLIALGFKDLKRQSDHSLYDFTALNREGQGCFIESRVRSEKATTQHLMMNLNKLDRLLELSKVAPVYLFFLNKYGHAMVDIKDLVNANKITTGNTTVRFITFGGNKFMKGVDEGPRKLFPLKTSPDLSSKKRIIPLTPQKQRQLVGIFSRKIDYAAVSELLNLGCWVFFHSLTRQRVWAAHNKLKKQFSDLLIFRAKLGPQDGYAFVTETKGKKIPTALVSIRHREKTVNNKNVNSSSERK